MTWKTVLSVTIDSPADTASLAAAQAVAGANDAHLDVLAMGVDRTQTGFHYTEMSAALLQTGLKEAQDAANALAEKTEAELKGAALRYAVSPLVAPVGGIGREVARHARFADVVVQALPYGEDAVFEEAPIVEAALFEARVPVLMVPRKADGFTAPRRVLLAWNESPEALAAAKAALPLLRETDVTYITVIDPPQHGPERSDPGGLLSQFLARHGVRCEVNVQAKSLPRIGDTLLRCAADRDADMIVMGGYGRARWSEAMFGGATRQMLEDATVPILLAH